MDYREIFLNVLFHEDASYWVYIAPVVDKRNVSVEYWQNDTEWENKSARRKAYPSVSFFYHKSLIDRPVGFLVDKGVFSVYWGFQTTCTAANTYCAYVIDMRGDRPNRVRRRAPL
jgi:hypothetical protein